MANLGDALVVEAKKHLGKPYVTDGGGQGPNQFDCSGLVNYCIMQVDPSKNFYWSVDYQYGAMPGPNISLSNRRPGDILFFVDSPGTSALTHNGIFTGGTQFIHAKNENSGVVYDDLNNSWWSDRLKYIKRVWPYSDTPVPEPEPEPVPDPRIPLSWSAGDLVEVTAAHTLRTGTPPNFQASTTGLAVGTQLAITGPHGIDTYGQVWWPIKMDSGYGTAGWAIQARLKRTFTNAFGTYRLRDLFDVTAAGTLREGTSATSLTVGTTALSIGDRLVATGPQAAAGSITWVPVSVVKNADRGWFPARQLMLMSRDKGSPAPEDSFPNKVVLEPLNLRSAPSTSGTLIATMPVGTLLKVHSGPTQADGYSWYKVEAQGFGYGYCVDGFVTTTPQNYPTL